MERQFISMDADFEGDLLTRIAEARSTMFFSVKGIMDETSVMRLMEDNYLLGSIEARILNHVVTKEDLDLLYTLIEGATGCRRAFAVHYILHSDETITDATMSEVMAWVSEQDWCHPEVDMRMSMMSEINIQDALAEEMYPEYVSDLIENDDDEEYDCRS